MPDRPSEPAGDTYLVEHYHPGGGAGELEQAVASVRKTIAEMQHEGRPVAYISSTIVPDDDYLHCVVRAPSKQLVVDALSRAGLAYQRIATAISMPGESDDLTDEADVVQRPPIEGSAAQSSAND